VCVCVLQLAADTLKPYLGSSPAAVVARAAVGAAAKRGMKERLTCQDLPAFRQSVENVLRRAYPNWYQSLFYSPMAWPQ
jgi:hypothetical protein